MARYSAGALTTAGSATLPIISLYASASAGGALREVGLTNTTATEVSLKLTRLSTAGTPGAALQQSAHDCDRRDAACRAFNTHSGGPTLLYDLGYRAMLGAAKGAGVIWTFGDTGIRIPVGTANGVGVIVENGTGQACQAYLCWDE